MQQSTFCANPECKQHIEVPGNPYDITIREFDDDERRYYTQIRYTDRRIRRKQMVTFNVDTHERVTFYLCEDCARFAEFIRNFSYGSHE